MLLFVTSSFEQERDNMTGQVELFYLFIYYFTLQTVLSNGHEEIQLDTD